jgi:predicted DNA binding protein
VFDPGVDPVMDTFIEVPELFADSIASCIRRDGFWSVERFCGPREALDRIYFYRFDSSSPREQMTETSCDADRHHNLLERTANSLVVYTFIERLHTCNSVMALAARHLDLGHVFLTQRSGDRQNWRLLMRSDANVDIFYDAIEDYLRDGITLRMGRLGEVEQWNFDSLATVSLSQKEQNTLRAAIEHGYYQTPRGITIGELANELDLPQSTVSYRLRQVEAQLAKGYAGRSDVDDCQSITPSETND